MEPEDLVAGTMAQPSRFAFVMPVRNGRETIRLALDAVIAAGRSWPGTEIVVVDNGSNDGTREILHREYATDIRLLDLPDSTVARVRNIGARKSSNNLIAFVDADCVIQTDYCERAAAALQRSGAAAVGSPYDLPRDPHWLERTWVRLHHRAAGKVKYVNAGNLVIRREAFDAVGGFDDRLTSGEDVDLGERLNRAGYLVLHAPEVRAVHLGNPATVAAFFRQQWWHALGTRLDRTAVRDKPLLLALVHSGFALGGLALALRADATVVERVTGLAGGQTLVPAIAVTGRVLKGGSLTAAPLGVLLYAVYFYARLTALGTLWFGIPRFRGRRR